MSSLIAAPVIQAQEVPSNWLLYSQDGDIHRINVDTLESQNLTHSAENDLFVSWSPDREWIIFRSDPDGNTAYDLYRMRLDGSDRAPLTQFPDDDVRFQGWSPDGEWLIFVPQPIFEPPSSGTDEPPGQVISNTDIYRVRLDGTDTQHLTTGVNSAEWFMSWSPDGEWIVYTVTEIGYSNPTDLYRMRPDGSDQQMLTKLGSVPAYGIRTIGWSDEWLLYEVSGTLYRLHLDATAPQELLVSPQAWFAGWDPDHQWIAFFSNDNGQVALNRMRADGSEKQLLTHAVDVNRFSNWSPDGAWIFFTGWDNETGEYGLYRVSWEDGAEQQRLAEGASINESVTWSPGGQWMLYVDSELHRMHPDGSDPIELTTPSTVMDMLSWSPDGEWIVFLSGDYHIYRMRPDGSEGQLITSEKMAWITDWLPRAE
jgi:Tol biopolymer transport system component